MGMIKSTLWSDCKDELRGGRYTKYLVTVVTVTMCQETGLSIRDTKVKKKNQPGFWCSRSFVHLVLIHSRLLFNSKCSPFLYTFTHVFPFRMLFTIFYPLKSNLLYNASQFANFFWKTSLTYQVPVNYFWPIKHLCPHLAFISLCLIF